MMRTAISPRLAMRILENNSSDLRLSERIDVGLRIEVCEFPRRYLRMLLRRGFLGQTLKHGGDCRHLFASGAFHVNHEPNSGGYIPIVW